MKWFQGGLVFKAHGLLYHSTLGSRVKKRKKKKGLGSLVLGLKKRDLKVSGFVLDSLRFRIQGLGCTLGFKVSRSAVYWGWGVEFGVRGSGPGCEANQEHARDLTRVKNSINTYLAIKFATEHVLEW